jgi:hypothetical protein
VGSLQGISDGTAIKPTASRADATTPATSGWGTCLW